MANREDKPYPKYKGIALLTPSCGGALFTLYHIARAKRFILMLGRDAGYAISRSFEAESDMESFNPYSPPDVDSGVARFAERYQYSRWHACGFLAASVFISLTYTCLDEVVYRTSIGAWPMLIGTAIIAFASVLVTKDVLVSPLCCFVGTVSGDILVGFVRGWGYAQLPVCIVLAIVLSIPSLLIGLLMRRLDGRPVPPSTSTLDL